MATKCAKQGLGVPRPCHRGAEDLRPKDRAGREGGLQRAGGAMGKGETPVNGGRGLPLIRALSHSTELETTATGTTVDITFRLPTESD